MSVVLYRLSDDTTSDRRVSVVDADPPDYLYFPQEPLPYKRVNRLSVDGDATYMTRPMTAEDAAELAPLVTGLIVDGQHPDYYLQNMTSAEVQPLVLYMLTRQDQLLGVPM